MLFKNIKCQDCSLTQAGSHKTGRPRNKLKVWSCTFSYPLTLFKFFPCVPVFVQLPLPVPLALLSGDQDREPFCAPCRYRTHHLPSPSSPARALYPYPTIPPPTVKRQGKAAVEITQYSEICELNERPETKQPRFDRERWLAIWPRQYMQACLGGEEAQDNQGWKVKGAGGWSKICSTAQPIPHMQPAQPVICVPSLAPVPVVTQ